MQSRISSVLDDDRFQRQVVQSGMATQEAVENWTQPEALDEAPPWAGQVENALNAPPFEAAPASAEPLSLQVEDLEATPFAGASPPVAGAVATPPPGAQEEAVVLLEGRPSLLVRGDRIEVPRSGIWAKPLLAARALVEPWLRSVGRVEIDDGFGSRHGGTGWMVAPGVVATNRHVAEAFSDKRGGQVVFLANFTGTTFKARIDFREEYQEPQQLEMAIEEVIFLQDRDPQLPDVALLRLAPDPQLPPPIPILAEPPRPGAPIAVVGYPAYDPRYGVDALEAAQAVFGSIYDVKRLSPGKVMDATDGSWFFSHDATTLGGNSGSVVLDLKSGLAVGMHFRGEFRSSNYAVLASEVAKLAEANSLRVSRVAGPAPIVPAALSELERPVAAEYSDREGYSESFLGEEYSIPLPQPSDRLLQDLVKWDLAGDRIDLPYTHFSVVVHAPRRMCAYSAVNIDGGHAASVEGRRPGWRVDPRIGEEFQILQECYGRESEGKFSRGHMTRREDPNWGASDVVMRANADTFHATNACPQIQPFNAGIWNNLEDYALQNARQDDMRVSVFTGPVFADDDPCVFGVTIPVRFWKIIAFIHDSTSELTATGYTMSQRDFMPGEEFVFGQFGTYQTPIRAVEQMTGLSFGRLADADPMGSLPETPARPLRGFEEILIARDLPAEAMVESV